jgi:ADP-heptose:LPS heptosyltransferase
MWSTGAPRRFLFLHFSGIGNGITVLPMLQRLEQVAPQVQYFHVDNPVFAVTPFLDWLGLKRFQGTVPASWRRFAEEDWEEILAFIRQQRIDTIVSLRNEGPARDLGYERFRLRMDKELEFWHLDQAAIASRSQPENLLDDQLRMLAERGLDLSGISWTWMRDHFTRSTGCSRPRVGLFTGVSQSVKRWPADRWIALGRQLLADTECELRIYAGLGEPEQRLAAAVVSALASLGPDRCTVVSGLSLYDLCADLAGLDLVVSNDTSCIHIAAALDLPAVGLYFSTVGAIWGGHSDKFTAIQSQYGLACPWLKPDAGNCELYYGDCPAPCQEEVTAARVYEVVRTKLAALEAARVHAREE